MTTPSITTLTLPDGREVRTRQITQGKHAHVKLHTSLFEGQWLWSFAVQAGNFARSSLPFPHFVSRPLAATEAAALTLAARAAQAYLDDARWWAKRCSVPLPTAPKSFDAWLEQFTQPTLFGGPE